MMMIARKTSEDYTNPELAADIAEIYHFDEQRASNTSGASGTLSRMSTGSYPSSNLLGSNSNTVIFSKTNSTQQSMGLLDSQSVVGSASALARVGPNMLFPVDLLKRKLSAVLSLANDAVASDTQQFYASALEKYKYVIEDLSEILVHAARYERRQRAKFTPKRRARLLKPESAQPTTSKSATLSATSLLSGGSSNTSSLVIEIRLSLAEKEVVIDLRDRYLERVNLLLSTLSPALSFQYRNGWSVRNPGPVDQIPPIPAHYRPTNYDLVFNNIMRTDPSKRRLASSDLDMDPHVRSFQLWARLVKTMSGGSFLTSDLFIPQDVWTQPNGSVQSLEFKLSTLSTLMPFLTRFKEHQQNDPYLADSRAFNRLADEFQVALDSTRNSLLKKLKFLAQNDDDKPTELYETSLMPSNGSMNNLTASTSAASTSSATPPSLFSGRDNPSKFISWGVLKLQKGIEKIKARATVSSDKQKEPTSPTSSPPKGLIPPLLLKQSGSIQYRDFMLKFLSDSLRVFWFWFIPIIRSENPSDGASIVTYISEQLGPIVDIPMVPLSPISHNSQQSLSSANSLGIMTLKTTPALVKDRIARFILFYDTIICPMLLSDLATLLEYFFKKMRKVSNA